MTLAVPVVAQEPTGIEARNDSLIIRLVDVDLRAAVQAIGRHLDRPVVFGAVPEARVTLETPHPVPRAELVALLRGLLDSHSLELVLDSAFYRIRAGAGSTGVAGDVGQDQDPRSGVLQLFVIQLRHARAADVAETVNALYGRAAALGELGTGPPATLTEQLERQQVLPMDAPPRPEQIVPGRVAVLEGEITIVPDLRTNSLLIRATPEDFELIQAAVAQVDVRPLQVLIEVVIAEVRKDRSFALGLQTTVPEQPVSGTDGARYSGSTTGLGLGDFVLRIMDLGGADLDLTLRAAASRGDATILSRPVLLAANNERAEMLVGSQRPFVQVQRALPTDNAARDQVVQYRDVGTKLSVRPTISADGYVMLEVSQEVNAATAEVAFDAPVISTRSVQTQLLVRDRQTAVIGGLADRQRDASKSGVPILSSIPVIGGLFGHTSERASETELFIFLTPRVLATDQDIDEASEAVRDSIGGRLPIRR